MRRKKKTPKVQKTNCPVRDRCEICTPITRKLGLCPWYAPGSASNLDRDEEEGEAETPPPWGAPSGACTRCLIPPWSAPPFWVLLPPLLLPLLVLLPLSLGPRSRLLQRRGGDSPLLKSS